MTMALLATCRRGHLSRASCNQLLAPQCIHSLVCQAPCIAAMACLASGRQQGHVRWWQATRARVQVCGSYYQGRGQHTHAFTHALETGHHMFMKLEDGRVYCLPDGYEVEDRSLDPIRYVLNPTFAPDKVLLFHLL